MKRNPVSSESVREFLEAQSLAFEKFVGKGDCFSSFVLRHGRTFKGAPLPKKFRKGKIKHCFENATRLAIKHPQLTYCEGYASSIIPVMHAWCVLEDGTVVDNTWMDSEECGYFGIPFKTEFLRRHLLMSGYYGLLDCHHLDFPIISGRFEPSEWLSSIPQPPELEANNKAAKE